MPKLTFTESEMKERLIIDRNLKPNERRDGRINVGCAILKNFVDGEDVIEVIIRKKS